MGTICMDLQVFSLTKYVGTVGIFLILYPKVMVLNPFKYDLFSTIIFDSRINTFQNILS